MSCTADEQKPWIVAEAFHAAFQAPGYHIAIEVILCLFIIYLVFLKKNKSDFKPLSKKEKQQLLDEWRPEPLVPPFQEILKNTVKYRAVSGPALKTITIDGNLCLNFSSTNFLNLLGDKRISTKVEECIRKYGVGSCGPRGFYGTIDVHLNLEKRIAEMMQCEKAIIYSYGFATVASAIPAYSKRGDILFVDEAVNFSIQKGIQASRSEVRYFRHNDMNDLEELLKEQKELDKKDTKKAAVTRKFMIVEGIYSNTGNICDLPRLIELKYKYKVRLFVEESFSFGVLGDHGRGVTEHFNVPISKVDMICANLENSVASVGGFSCGSQYVVSHQELSGQGYVFSASLPPLVSQASIEALNIMEAEPEMFAELRSKAAKFYQLISSINAVDVTGYPESALFHVRRSMPLDDFDCEERVLNDIVLECSKNGLCVALDPRLKKNELQLDWPPSIRVTVSIAMTNEDLNKAFNIFKNAINGFGGQ